MEYSTRSIVAGGAAAAAILVGLACWWRGSRAAGAVAVAAGAAGLGYLVLGGGRRRRRRNPGRRGELGAARRRAPRPRLTPLERERRSCRISALREARPVRFRYKADAIAALLAANPRLRALVDSDCGQGCRTFREWHGRGRRGAKPRAAPGDGRFDALNEYFEKRTAGRRVASWLEALYLTAPRSRRWEDFEARLPALEEAAGFRLNLPERTERITVARADSRRCDDIDAPAEVPF